MTYKWILNRMLFLLLIPINVLADCPSVVESDKENYYIQGGGLNLAPFYNAIASATKSYSELVERVQQNTLSLFASYGYNLVLNGSTDGPVRPTCFILYLNGKEEPEETTNWARKGCGAYFFPVAFNFRGDGSSKRCPVGYTLGGDDQCYLNDPELTICPAPEKDVGPPPDYCGIGNPINHANGAKYAQENDIPQLSNNWGFSFNRFYSHLKTSEASWSYTFKRKLSITSPVESGHPPSSIVAYRDDEQGTTFKLVNGIYKSTANELNLITPTTNGWLYSDYQNNSTELYDSEGRVTEITSIDGSKIFITYSDSTSQKYPISAPSCQRSLPPTTVPSAKRIACVTNELGIQLNFEYDSARRLSKVIDPAGGVYSYIYDDTLISNVPMNASNIISVSYPDGSIKSYKYGEEENISTTLFSDVYYNNALYNALTGIVDENGKRFATYKYDSSGRAISTEHALGANKFSVNYVTNTNNNILYSKVIDPMGNSSEYHFDTILGSIKMTSQSQPAGSGCNASTFAMSYDANGNVASRTDFNGNKTTYVYDMARNLETSRTEGLSSTGAATPATRTITTTYHATWRLPLVISEYTGASATGTPLKRTTYVYDAKGNITSYKEEDPVRALSRTTTTTYTYSTAVPGLVLQKVVNGPRTDVTDVTTYTYYPHDAVCAASSAEAIIDPITGTAPANLGCRGQLQSVRNALGHTTTYDRYNHHGQVEQMTDANGVVTTNTYDLRQRLLSRSVGNTKPETTSLVYDDAGQIIQLIMPDASTLSYTYDDAHRLIQIQDTLGNKVVYTLDAQGNRTQETLTDPLGNLTKTITRSYDALNRLQQVTGVE